MLHRYHVVPVRVAHNRLMLAMADPLDYFAIDDVRMKTGLQVQPLLTSRADIEGALSSLEMRGSCEGRPFQEGYDQESDTPIMDENSPVVQTVNEILERAVSLGASDVHFDPGPDSVAVRLRVDGVLRTERILPKTMQAMVTARIKVQSNLDVAERRLPQDGRFRHQVDGRDVDIRVSTLPTIHEEKTVLRLFDVSLGLLRVDKIGLSEGNLETVKRMLRASSGMLLVTGPTGSGKTSTVYAALAELNKSDVNIITVEDPVEYQIGGVNQVAVNAATGLTFSSGLRSILRQDPDIIMVGEIRDGETAEIATRAALTGHLVLSTLHTGGAVETIARMVDMGVEPYLVASAIHGIVAQSSAECVPIAQCLTNRPKASSRGCANHSPE